MRWWRDEPLARLGDAARGAVTEELAAIIERMALLERDHEPDGWPAVQMRDITALRCAIARLRVEADHAWAGLAGEEEDGRRYRFVRDSAAAEWRPIALRDGCSDEVADSRVDAAIARLAPTRLVDFDDKAPPPEYTQPPPLVRDDDTEAARAG